MVLLNARNLTKSYKDKKAVDSLSLTVNSGEILGLVGPNGAGKTTTIRMITTILPADSGSVEICGYDIYEKSQNRTAEFQPDSTGRNAQLPVECLQQHIHECHGQVRNIPRSQEGD